MRGMHCGHALRTRVLSGSCLAMNPPAIEARLESHVRGFGRLLCSASAFAACRFLVLRILFGLESKAQSGHSCRRTSTCLSSHDLDSLIADASTKSVRKFRTRCDTSDTMGAHVRSCEAATTSIVMLWVVAAAACAEAATLPDAPVTVKTASWDASECRWIVEDSTQVLNAKVPLCLGQKARNLRCRGDAWVESTLSDRP